MRVSHRITENRLEFEFSPQPNDRLRDIVHSDTKNIYHFGQNTCYIEVPRSAASRLHPDVLALIVILIVDSYTDSIELDFSVSPGFAQAYYRVRGKTIGPVDDSVTQRKSPTESRPALTFSGGVDSTAALYLMPKNTRLYHAERVDIGYPMLFNARAGVEAAQVVERRGYDTRVVPTDYMYVRNHPGQIEHASPGIVALVWSEEDNLDSIANADTFEAFYKLTYNKFSPKPNPTYTWYSDLFEVVGMPIMNLTAGLSEVVTQRIIVSEGDGDVAQACVAGSRLGAPCEECIKCFRKSFLNSVIKQETLSSDAEVNLTNNRYVFEALDSTPVRYQALYAYIFALYNRLSPTDLSASLKRKLSLSPGYARFLNRYYKPAIKHIPPKYRDEVLSNIGKYADKMRTLDYIALYMTRLTVHKYNPLLLYRHQKFMNYFGRLTGRYRLLIKAKDNYTVSASYHIKLLERRGLLWRNITNSTDVKWGSSDGGVAYVKHGKLVARSRGDVSIRATHNDNVIRRKITILAD